MGFDIGALLGGILSGTGLGIGRSGMHAPTPEQAGANLLREASAAGLSPLALAGAPTQTGFGASVGDPGMAGQLLARSITADRTADDRMTALREQNLALENARLSNDVVAGQIRNSMQRTSLGIGTPPPRVRANLEPFGPFWPQGIERPKPGLQAIIGSDGKTYFIPSAAVQQGLWSPLPGLPANPQAAADVVRANAAGMPPAPDVARMSGLPPGAINFVSGTAPFSWSNFLPDWR